MVHERIYPSENVYVEVPTWKLPSTSSQTKYDQKANKGKFHAAIKWIVTSGAPERMFESATPRPQAGKLGTSTKEIEIFELGSVWNSSMVSFV